MVLAWIDERGSRHRITLGADKAYEVLDFAQPLDARNVTPHVQLRVLDRSPRPGFELLRVINVVMSAAGIWKHSRSVLIGSTNFLVTANLGSARRSRPWRPHEAVKRGFVDSPLKAWRMLSAPAALRRAIARTFRMDRRSTQRVLSTIRAPARSYGCDPRGGCRIHQGCKSRARPRNTCQQREPFCLP